MLTLSGIDYTIWKYDEEKDEWSIVEAISIAGSKDEGWYEASDRTDMLATLFPDYLFVLYTAHPVNKDECLKKSRHHGKVLNKE